MNFFLVTGALLVSVAVVSGQYKHLPYCDGNPVAKDGACIQSYPGPEDECHNDYDCHKYHHQSTCCRGPCNNRCTLPYCYGYGNSYCSYGHKQYDECHSVHGCQYGKTCCIGKCKNECRG